MIEAFESPCHRIYVENPKESKSKVHPGWSTKTCIIAVGVLRSTKICSITVSSKITLVSIAVYYLESSRHACVDREVNMEASSLHESARI